ncbi:HAUS augmin-like complex subunit 7 [Osmerus mordax]|uniref:HAUS augmin-like complex subunit 7 n=1 Tax=Osmerus mordax TaxID=8014 RepID=UPI00350F1AE1
MEGKMAGALKENQLALNVYTALQAASCALVEGLFLREPASMLDLLCTPSQHRTDILTWICTTISPSLSKRLSSIRTRDPDTLNQELAGFGHEMMLCEINDLDLIKGSVCPLRQLQFLEQLLTLVPGCVGPAGDSLLRELFNPEAQSCLTHILQPSLNPWPVDIRAPRKGLRSVPSMPRARTDDVTALLQSTQTALEQLQAECEFLRGEAQRPSVFSACALRVALCDLLQLMAVFSRVYDADLRPYCSRAPPNPSTHTHTFSRVHQLLLTCSTELGVLQQVSEVCECVVETVRDVNTGALHWRHGEKHPLSVQLEALSGRYRDFLHHQRLPASSGPSSQDPELLCSDPPARTQSCSALTLQPGPRAALL